MSSLTRSAARKPSKPSLGRKGAQPAPIGTLSDAERKALKARFLRVALITLGCCFLALIGMSANVSLHQWWGMPLFVLAMLGGFGSQIAFIIGLVKANRTDKGA